MQIFLTMCGAVKTVFNLKKLKKKKKKKKHKEEIKISMYLLTGEINRKVKVPIE